MTSNLFLFIALCALACVYINWLGGRDAESERMYTCVIETARTQHYHGDPATSEAYALFAKSCAR